LRKGSQKSQKSPKWARKVILGDKTAKISLTQTSTKPLGKSSRNCSVRRRRNNQTRMKLQRGKRKLESSLLRKKSRSRGWQSKYLNSMIRMAQANWIISKPKTSSRTYLSKLGVSKSSTKRCSRPFSRDLTRTTLGLLVKMK